MYVVVSIIIQCVIQSLSVFFVSPMTRTFKEAIDHANARSIRGYATAACVVLEKRQLPNITRGRTPYQGCLEVFFLVARVSPGPRARAHGNGPFFSESPHRHARTGNRPPYAALSFFLRPRDISGRALVTGYAPTSRPANF